MFKYFDMGLYRFVELRWMVEYILPALGIEEYEAHGFEACASYADNAREHFNNNPRVHIHQVAVGGHDGHGKLFHSPSVPCGHSVFDDKKNVDPSNWEPVTTCKFSSFIKNNKVVFGAFNMMKINIEGAEWDLFVDLVESGLIKQFDVVSGSIRDVKKIARYHNRYAEYLEYLDNNRIKCHEFTGWKEETRDQMLGLLRNLLGGNDVD